MRLFGHIVRKNTIETRLIQGEVDAKRLDKSVHGGCIPTGTDRKTWSELISVTGAQIAPPD